MAGHVTDRRLGPALSALAAGQVKVLSVDVFDTLLWRRVPEPKDAFLLLGRRLAAEGRLAAHVNPVAFAELRHAAEKAARARREAATGSREVTLPDIYRALPSFLFAPDFDADAAAAAEVALEATLMIRDRAVAALMAAAKAAGARVILVSDTYFASAQVKRFLAKPGLAEGRDFDRLYVSCEAGRPKWRDLFDTILRDAAVPAAATLHVGDSLEADVLPCRLRGIGVVHYDKWSFSPRVQAVEMPAELAPRAVRLGSHGDRGLTGLRSRLAHQAPEEIAPDLVPYWSYGAATLAPVFAAFARWAVAACAVSGTSRILGIMREGRFLNRLVGDTAAALGVALATEELWLSRRAVIRAALCEETAGLLPEFAMLSPGRTTAEVLAEMGLTAADLAAAGMPDFDVTVGDALVRLCQAVGAAPHLLAKVFAVAAHHRDNLLSGLGRQIDLPRTDAAVVMDLGYSATIQSVLQGILDRAGHALRLTGLYLALNRKALDNLRGGADLRGYLDAEGFGGTMGRLLSRVPFVLEHACMCDEGSLSHFDAAGAPVLLPNQRGAAQLAQMAAMQAGILHGVAQVNELLGDLATTPADDPELKAQVAAIVEAAHLYPTAQEAATVGAWKHEAKIDFTNAYRLNDLAFDGAALEYRGWPALQDMTLDQVYWPAAAFAAADPFIADVHAGGAKDAYKAHHLTAGPVLGRVTVCPDAGAGFDERRQGTIPMAMNAFGRGDLNAAIKGMGPDVYRRLRLTWPDCRGILRLDRVAVTYLGEGERRTVEIDLGTAAWTGAQALEGGAMQLARGAVTVLDLGAPPAWPHGLELSLRFKYLRLDPLFGGAP
jgi:FMN phosphatase YigB (HAD superfamily)